VTDMDLVSVFCRQIDTFVGEVVFSPSYVFGTFVKNEEGIAVWIHIWVLYCVPLVFISIFFFFASTVMFLLLWLLVQFEVRYCETASISLFSSLLPWYLQSFAFPNEF
jgi:hypothetical protein